MSLSWLLRIVIAALFLLSAVAKLYPGPTTALATFEAKQLLPMGFSEGVAPYLSRLLIITELSVGVALLRPHYLKRLVVPIAAAILFVFSLHLSYGLASLDGLGENCGCFGQLIPMTPLQALIKNITAMGLLFWLFKRLTPDPENQRLSPHLLIFTTLGMVIFAAAPVQLASPSAGQHNSTAVHTVPPSSRLLTPELAAGQDLETSTRSPQPPHGPTSVVSAFSAFPQYIPEDFQIDHDRKLLCLFAPGCDHCRDAIKTLTRMREESPEFPPLHIVFMDEATEEIPVFFEQAGHTYSYRVAPVADFWKMIDFSRDTPGVVYLWNGNIRYFADGTGDNAFNEEDLKASLTQR